MKIRVRAFGLAVGIVVGVGMLLVTLMDVFQGKGKTLASLNSFFIGYSVSYSGAIVGLIWGFVDGFICGALFAMLYNMLNKVLYKSEGNGA